MWSASAVTRGRQKARMPRAIRMPRPIIALWSPRSNWPELSNPLDPCRPKLIAVNSTTTPAAVGSAIQRIFFGLNITTFLTLQPAIRDVGDQDGAGAQLVELVHDPVHVGPLDHGLDGDPA